MTKSCSFFLFYQAFSFAELGVLAVCFGRQTGQIESIHQRLTADKHGEQQIPRRTCTCSCSFNHLAIYQRCIRILVCLLAFFSYFKVDLCFHSPSITSKFETRTKKRRKINTFSFFVFSIFFLVSLK